MLVRIQFTDVTTLNFEEPALVVKFIGETMIPLLAISLFASYLAYYGGALPAIAYLGILRGFEMYSPILPDLDWLVKALIQVIAPTIGFLLIQQSIQETSKHVKLTKKLKKRRDPTVTWVALSVVCVLFIFFSYGYFGVQPTVINSGSMRPAIDTGDIVLLTDVQIDEIQEGDIIQYYAHNFSTVHRVYEIRQLNQGIPLVIITKGDANNAPDVEPVSPEQVTGKAIFTIPKLGWIPLVIKDFINRIGFNV
jgi:signal peptidase